MALGKRKFLYCSKCQSERWATLLIRYTFKCSECDSEIDLRAAKKQIQKERKQARTEKSKHLGTYKSEATKKRERTERRSVFVCEAFMLWIKRKRCVVPGCFKSPCDAHHVIHRSQGRDDRKCAPLCHEHHMEYHANLGSVEAASKDWKINLLVAAEHFWREYQREISQSEVASKLPAVD